jgi:hypothetical protein
MTRNTANGHRHRSTTPGLIVLLGSLVLAASCIVRPTQVRTDWRDPTAAPVRFQRAAIIFVAADSTLRREAEDRLAKRVRNAVPSYSLISEQQLAAADTHAIRSALAEGGFDGVLVVRLLGVATQSGGATIPASTPSEDLWAYLRGTPRSALAPGNQTTVTMESRIYSTTNGKLLWAGHSQSFNPLSLSELLNMLVDASADEIRRQGLL